MEFASIRVINRSTLFRDPDGALVNLFSRAAG